MASPSDPPTDRASDTAQFPVTRVSTAAATDTDDVPSTGGPAHAVTAGTPGISRAGWWAITIAAAVLLVLGFLLTFGPARYWTPVPVVFLGYFLLSGVTGLVFWKGVRELRDSNPTLHSGDGPATPGARVAAAIGAVGVASALVLLPAGLSDAPANAAPCPDGSNTCGPQPTMGPQPTQGNGGNTTAPQAPNTTVPGYTPPDTPPQQGNGSTPTVQGQVPTMPTGESPSNGCIFNCGPTQAPQAPQTGQATPPQTAQNPVTTAPNTPATTPQAPTTTPRLRTPTPETTTSTTSSKARDRDDDQQRSSDEDREKNSGIPYQAAEIAALAGTYRRKKTSDAVRDGQVVSENATRTLYTNATAVSKPVQDVVRDLPGDAREADKGRDDPGLQGPDVTPENPTRHYLGTDRPPVDLGKDDFEYGSQKPTMDDRKNWLKWGAKNMAAEALRPDLEDATRFYEHYRGNSGDPMSFNLERAAKEDSNVRRNIESKIAEARGAAEAFAKTGNTSFSMIGSATTAPYYPSTENWQKTIGSYQQWTSSTVSVQGKTITMTTTVHAEDRYNFNRGAADVASGAPDNDNGRFAEIGFAKPFNSSGELTQVTTWTMP